MHLGGNKKQVIHSQATSVSHGHLMGFTAHQGLQIQRYTFLTLDITVVNLHRLWMLIKRGCSRQPGTLICHCSCLSPLISLLACIEFLSNAGRVSTSHSCPGHGCAIMVIITMSLNLAPQIQRLWVYGLRIRLSKYWNPLSHHPNL